MKRNLLTRKTLALFLVASMVFAVPMTARADEGDAGTEEPVAPVYEEDETVDYEISYSVNEFVNETAHKNNKAVSVFTNFDEFKFTEIVNGTTVLTKGTDYVVNANVITLSTDYLLTLPTGNYEFGVKMISNASDVLTFKVSVVNDDVKAAPAEAPAETPAEAPAEAPTETPAETPEVPEVATWYTESFAYLKEKGILKDLTADAFKGDTVVTRAMAAMTVYNMDGSVASEATNPFNDVTADEWFAAGIVWAAENGIVAGVTENTFVPNASITREQLSVILYNYCEFKEVDMTATADLSKFADADQISDYALKAMTWANANGIINGKSATTLAPTATVTLAELSMMVYQLNK